MKIKPTLLCFVCLPVAIIASYSSVNAYDDSTVHPAVNERAVRQSILDDYIKNKLEYPEGILKTFAGERVLKWLREGGTDEDNSIRFLRHFHDPLKPWDQAGLWGNDSALVWAQRSDQSIFGTYSWVTARDSFYQALTTGSETEFATTFRSLGQVMHLVSDMAVPAHVRNDPHPFSDTYEDWTTEHQKEFQYVNNTPVDLSIFSNPAPSTVAPLSISALWDQDIYDGSNPDRLWSINAGLAEFTNANFLSGDTFGEYPHPNFTDPGLLYEIQWHDRPTVMAEDNKADSPAYIWRLVGGQQKYRLAAANYFAIETEDGGFNKTLDDEVNKDYAKELIPRAIGYSTALLDYFFRGDIDLKPGSGGGYALVNNTSENMTGTFAVYYDDTSGTRRKLVEWASTTVPANGRTQVGSIAIPDGHANPAKYFLVFKGTMGREAGAVAGRVVSLRPPKEYALITMSTASYIYSSVITKEEAPDIAIVWDMETNSYAPITDTNGAPISFPISHEELLSRTNKLSDYQQGSSEKLLSVGSYSGDQLPDCPLQYQTNYTYGNEGLCNKWWKSPYTATGNCEAPSPLTGGENTISIYESGDGNAYNSRETSYTYREHCLSWHYDTYNRDSTNNKTIHINSTGVNTKLLDFPFYAQSSIFPNSYQIIKTNNDSDADDIFLNNVLEVGRNTNYHYASAYGWEGLQGCALGWQITTTQIDINATLHNDFFGWQFVLPSKASVAYAKNDYTSWWSEPCGNWQNHPPWSPIAEEHKTNIALTSLSYDVSGSGIQSTTNNINQFQIGIIYSSIRELHVTLDENNESINNSATYGQINNYIRAFCSQWPNSTDNTTSYARNKNPWTLPRNDSLEGAIEEMTRYFAQNFGEDPAQLRPDFFAKLNFDGGNTPLSIAQRNLWHRNFDIQYLTTLTHSAKSGDIILDPHDPYEIPQQPLISR